MKYAIFLGCTAPVRAKHYEFTARKVCERFGIELTDVPDFACCGFPLKNASADAAFLLAARNLAAAEAAGVDGVATLCSSCAATLAETNREIRSDKRVMDRTNASLADLGKHYTGKLTVKHLARLLLEDVGTDAIRSAVERDLSSLRIAAHPGCHYLKPGEVHGHFDAVEDPRTLDELISATGAVPVSYEDKKLCCGGAVLGFEEGTALAMAKHKLDLLKESGVDAMVSICPFCSVMYEANQGKIEETYDVQYGLPILYYPQLLGLAIGLPEKELWFRMNSIRPQAMLEKIATE